MEERRNVVASLDPVLYRLFSGNKRLNIGWNTVNLSTTFSMLSLMEERPQARLSYTPIVGTAVVKTLFGNIVLVPPNCTNVNIKSPIGKMTLPTCHTDSSCGFYIS